MSLQKLKEQLENSSKPKAKVQAPDVSAIVSKGKAELRSLNNAARRKAKKRICFCGVPGCNIGPFHEETEHGTPDFSTGPFDSK